jgi:hypothetical protein
MVPAAPSMITCNKFNCLRNFRLAMGDPMNY